MSHKKEIRRTSKTRRPRRGSSGTPTATAEDYLERIYALIEEKGYGRVSDIAEALQVRPSTVTRMVQKLDEQNLLEYQRYRGLSLTEEGERSAARSIAVTRRWRPSCTSSGSTTRPRCKMISKDRASSELPRRCTA